MVLRSASADFVWELASSSEAFEFVDCFPGVHASQFGIESSLIASWVGQY